ncbi:hypothetical protein [Rhizobium favelukesii]|uniref:hypothetical protein n=1 Tax=Rhizobium favelukesii TaxID=348824 RepID=UPI00055DE0E5|nr:hypothetical protein [Rhizobium favelukesii]
MRVLIIGLALLLAGCQSQEVSEMSYSQTKDLAIQKNKECAAQGIKPGTNEMKMCVTHEMNREAALRHNRNARLQAAANSSTYCQGYGNSVVCF